MEKAASNTSPKIKPTVGVVLIGHSMGGFVAADTLLSILNDIPSTVKSPLNPQPPAQMFPLIHGILCFDTPLVGLSRSMFAYGALSTYQGYSSASSLFSLLSMRMGPQAALFTLGSFAYKNRDPLQRGLSSMREMKWEDWTRMKDEATGQGEDGKTIYSWDQVQEGMKYLSKENLGEGMAFLSGHLEFVSCLFRGVELQERLERVGGLRGVGFADLYTTLGPTSFYSGGFLIPERTFCALPSPPSSPLNRFFLKQPTTHPTASTDEIKAHLSMFKPELNTSYESMSQASKGLIASWATNNTGRVADVWRMEQKEKEHRWEALSRYTMDADGDSLKDVDAEAARKAKESYWFTPDVSSLGKYVPSVPSVGVPSLPSLPGSSYLRSSSKSRPTSKDGPAEKAAAGNEVQKKDEETLKEEAKAEDGQGTAPPPVAKPSYTSYLWSTGSGATESRPTSASGEKKEQEQASGRSWLEYGYSYLPNRAASSKGSDGTGEENPGAAGGEGGEGGAKMGLDELDRLMGMGNARVPGVTEDIKFS